MKPDDVRLKNLIPPKPGEVRNPNGRGPSRNRDTVLKKVAELIHKDGDAEIPNPFDPKGPPLTKYEKACIVAMEKAIQGDLGYFREVQDTLFGKIKEVHEIIPADITKKEVDELTDEEAAKLYDATSGH